MRNAKPILCADFFTGEGHVSNLDNFRVHEPLMRLDLLKDWIWDLEQEYNATHKECFK